MRLNSIFCSMATVSMMLGAASCQNDEDVTAPVNAGGVDLTKSEVVSLSVQMPGDMKSRAASDPTMTYGEDGLFSFDRTIDHLWYAVYNNGTLLYHSKQPGITQAVYNSDNNAFTLDIQVPLIDGAINLKDYSVFFFAGNAADKVETREITDGIGLDFANKTVYAYPTMMNKNVLNGEMYDPKQYDYFAKYTTLDKVVNNRDTKNGNVTLIRPFAQVTLLTDELVQPTVISTYSSTGKLVVQTTPSVSVKKSGTTQTLPYGWNYGTDNILTKNIADLAFTVNANAHNNATGTLTIPQVVTFKERKMFTVASYLMLAPSTRKKYEAGSSAEQFSFNLDVTGNLHSTAASVSANIPTGGLKANEKYVIYNKKYDPSTDEGGDGGIFSSHYYIDIVVDPTWDKPNQDIQF